MPKSVFEFAHLYLTGFPVNEQRALQRWKQLPPPPNWREVVYFLFQFSAGSLNVPSCAGFISSTFSSTRNLSCAGDSSREGTTTTLSVEPLIQGLVPDMGLGGAVGVLWPSWLSSTTFAGLMYEHETHGDSREVTMAFSCWTNFARMMTAMKRIVTTTNRMQVKVTARPSISCDWYIAG